MNYDNLKEEVIHHLLPAFSGAGLSAIFDVNFVKAVAVGVSIWLVTHILSAVFEKRKSFFNKIKSLFESAK
jgi:hypothetical protein